MKRYGFLIAFMATILLLASCSQELAVTTTDGGGTPVRFSVAAGQMRNTAGAVTRSMDLSTVSETEITNLWVMQFSSTGTFLKGIYIPAVNSSAVDIALVAGSSTHVYFLANWGSSVLASFSGTETALGSITRTLSTESDILYNGTTFSGKMDLPMISTMQTISVPSNGYINMSGSPITLNYAVARMNVTYNVTASNFVLRRIRVCNIPQIHELCPPAAAGATATYPNPGGVLTSSAVFNTPYTDITSNSGIVTFYVPENQRGQVISNTAETQKTGISGDNPTYIDLVGYTTANDGRGEIRYRIYPGADAIKDYNVVRGTQYAVTANITGTQLTDARLSEQALANSYIVAPGQTIYIPVKRANQTSELGVQFSDVTSSSLTASLAWQSSLGLVTPIMDNTSGCLKVTAPSVTATGNAVVAVKSGGTVVWSWHIWVTGYDPNSTNMAQNGLVWMDRI